MILHIVLFRWKLEVTEEQIQDVMEKFKNLKSEIPEIRELYCGENFSKWAKGNTHAVVVMTQNRVDLEAYRNHPLHLPIAKMIEELEEDSLGFDFET